MNEHDIKRLALILAIQAEIEGGKAENKYYEMIGGEIPYREDQFYKKAEELRELANKHNEQL
jgi:hypothetical protein